MAKEAYSCGKRGQTCRDAMTVLSVSMGVTLPVTPVVYMYAQASKEAHLYFIWQKRPFERVHGRHAACHP